MSGGRLAYSDLTWELLRVGLLASSVDSTLYGHYKSDTRAALCNRPSVCLECLLYMGAGHSAVLAVKCQVLAPVPLLATSS